MKKIIRIGERIKELREEKSMSIAALHSLIIKHQTNDNKITGLSTNPLSYRNLLRIENGQTQPRISNLKKISTALGISLDELLENTDRGEPPSKHAYHSKFRNGRYGRYTYDHKAPDSSYLEYLVPSKAPFSATELFLDPKTKTNDEEHPKGSEILVICSKGSIKITIHDETFLMSQGDTLYFEGHYVHRYENVGKRKARAIIIETPKNL
ncbi:MAG: helix-turn-helix transcriptional regulator [Candidatus Omnitrophica bacterium]|nr:helix-turn-helix transcriptional regulator [Candidatus Omnitrophota bacterium]